jgi:hypothetical protein
MQDFFDGLREDQKREDAFLLANNIDDSALRGSTQAIALQLIAPGRSPPVPTSAASNSGE